MAGPYHYQSADPGITMGDLGNAWTAGRANSPYVYAQGQAGVHRTNDMVYVEAGGGENAAAAFIPPRTEYYPVAAPSPAAKPMRRSRRFWIIVVLVLVIFVIIAAIGIGVGIHEADESSNGDYGET